MLNPLWGEQFNGLNGNTPGPGPKPEGSPNEPWSSSQTDWDIATTASGSLIAGFACSHKNWLDSGGRDRLRAATYTGMLTWESHSDGWPINDDDYSFNLVPMSLTGGPNGAGLQLNEDHIHVEYNFSEVGNRFDQETPWWSAFHKAVDNSDLVPTPFDMLTSRTAIVTGLLGMDTGHEPPGAPDDVGGETEIHPIWAMAARVKDDSGVRTDIANETWMFMARNWGDEGYCADGTQWTLTTDKISILIPWRAGATKIVGLTGEFSIVNPPDSNLQNNVSVTYAGTAGVLLTFKLNQPDDEPDEDGTVTEGELTISWSRGGLINNANAATSAPPVIFRKGKHDNAPDSPVPGLLEKMTPKQRAAFLALAPPKPVAHGHLVQMAPAVQLTALPARPENAATIKPVASKRWSQLEKSRLAALHAIFGATIPRAKDPEKK
ncbi:MAG: hypothetical protein WAM91_04490 [Candidatus Acidiferrales bacterium]